MVCKMVYKMMTQEKPKILFCSLRFLIVEWFILLSLLSLLEYS